MIKKLLSIYDTKLKTYSEIITTENEIIVIREMTDNVNKLKNENKIGLAQDRELKLIGEIDTETGKIRTLTKKTLFKTNDILAG